MLKKTDEQLGRLLTHEIVSMIQDKSLKDADVGLLIRAIIGFKTIKICSNLDDATLAAAAKQRDGVAVKFQLLKKVGAGDYVQCGEVQDKPVFNVEADELEPRTFWKIQTIFSEEY